MKKQVMTILLSLVLVLGLIPTVGVADAVEPERSELAETAAAGREEQSGKASLSDSSKAEMTATTRHQDGTTTVNVNMTDLGSGVKGRLLCVAYDSTGRMLAAATRDDISLQAGGKQIFQLTLEAPKDAVYKVFFTGKNSVPLAKPATGKPGQGGGIGGDNETEILP